jgi:hypothetical protein
MLLPSCLTRFLFVLLAAVCAGPTFAAERTAKSLSHAEILKRMPAELLGYTSAALGANGLPPNNVAPSPPASPLQLGSALQLALAAARGDVQQAEDCWPVIEATLGRQTKSGDFGSPPAQTAFWLGSLCRSLLVVQQTPMAARFKERIEKTKPAIVKAMHWLQGERARLLFEERTTPDRLFSEAGAFLFSGRLLKDPAMTQAGEKFVDEGMDLYRPANGVFLQKNGSDLACQAACLVHLQEIVLHFPDKNLEDAIAKGVQWELAHVGADGSLQADARTSVFSPNKPLTGSKLLAVAGELSLALLYFHERTGDSPALAAAHRLHDRYAAPQQ